ENWGSLLVQDIRFADAPEGADEDVIAALLLSEEQAPAWQAQAPAWQKQAQAPAWQPKWAAAKWAAAQWEPIATEPSAKWSAATKKAKYGLPKLAASEAVAAGSAMHAAAAAWAATAGKQVSWAQPGPGQQFNLAASDGLAKSGAVAAFRQSQQAGEQFTAGWQGGGAHIKGGGGFFVKRPAAKPKGVVGTTPFQKAFLEPPEALDIETTKDMNRRREELQIEVALLDHLDTFPPLGSFEDLQGILPDYAFACLAAMGIEGPMAIQAQALPLVLAGLDLIGIAKTGSGKTLAYLLPALPHIEVQPPLPRQDGSPGSPLALVLAPTRELAVQISDEAKKLVQASQGSSRHPGGVGAGVLYGGGSASKGWQLADIQRAGHIVAATPGRLLDVMSTGEVSLDRVTYLVLDEADRMLECGFGEQVGCIGLAVRSDRQTLFFSATWPDEVEQLASAMCSSGISPAKVMVGQRGSGDGPASREDIVQEVVVFNQPSWEARDLAKQELLYAHLRETLAVPEHKVLVFVSRKSLADELGQRLWDEGFQANTMHGGKSQEHRLAAIEGFRTGQYQLLVATDVMGRGLDIPNISHVVVFDMGEIDDYVHRIGRTARGLLGKGHALTFFEYDRKWPGLARELCDVLVASSQQVPPDLIALVNNVNGQGEGQGDGDAQNSWVSWT
ncbi:unnamed protein product, partial [Polarella glacialis]